MYANANETGSINVARTEFKSQRFLNLSRPFRRYHNYTILYINKLGLLTEVDVVPSHGTRQSSVRHLVPTPLVIMVFGLTIVLVPVSVT